MPKSSPSAVVSYLKLRCVVGALGVALPILLATWGFQLSEVERLLPSLSDYADHRTSDAFAGILLALGCFLYTYRGYARGDDIAGNIAGAAALGVAFFRANGEAWESKVHFGSAAALFLTLAYFSLCLFTKSSGEMTERKKLRNRVYRISGWSMLGCLALLAAYFALDGAATSLADLRPVFWLESLTLWCFGFAWFVKGEALWADRGG